jgi:hypothetical protein
MSVQVTSIHAEQSYPVHTYAAVIMSLISRVDTVASNVLRSRCCCLSGGVGGDKAHVGVTVVIFYHPSNCCCCCCCCCCILSYHPSCFRIKLSSLCDRSMFHVQSSYDKTYGRSFFLCCIRKDISVHRVVYYYSQGIRIFGGRDQ